MVHVEACEEYDCHYTEPYGFVPEAGCPVHDAWTKEARVYVLKVKVIKGMRKVVGLCNAILKNDTKKTDRAILNCRNCGGYGRWHVWYKGLDGPFAYNTLCNECVAVEIENGREEWSVSCIKLVADQFLQENDPALQLGKS